MDIIIRGGPAGECSRWHIYRVLSKALETGTFLHRGPIKYHGGPFTGISERYLNGGSGNGDTKQKNELEAQLGQKYHNASFHSK
jgi:hypothetical protein